MVVSTSSEIKIEPLKLPGNWATVGHMLENYAGVDPEFERVVGKGIFRLFMRWLGLPVYYGVLNKGYVLRVAHQPAGVLYLQHRKIVTHINDIEINKPYQGRGLSYKLLDFAGTEAHRRKKPYLTLAVTISNERAVNLYRKTGYVSQHHHYYQLNRAGWQEPTPLTPEQRKIELDPLDKRQAKANLRRFFETEMQEGVPDFAPVWSAYYAPSASTKSGGLSLGVKWRAEDKDFSGHVDFFRYYGRARWRLYLPKQYWGTPQEKNLLEVLIYESRDYQSVSFSFGTAGHHNLLADFMQEHDFQSRSTDRMLMIKKLDAR
jgi:ribosomal protein S18 acetylase RimI-like enzyme